MCVLQVLSCSAGQGASPTMLISLLLSYTAVVATATGHGRGRGRERERERDEDDCMYVQQQCASNTGCSIALSNYMLMCGPVVHGEVPRNECTLECRNALITLLSMDDRQGEVFMTCQCNGNEICEQQKRRLEVCHEEVIHAVPAVMDNLTDISCTLAQQICSADTSCFTALRFYERHCYRLVQGEKCTAKCYNSLSILYSQRKARKLRTCLCDGTEKYNCEELKYNTQTLCSSRHRGTTEHVRHHHDTHTRAHVPTPTPTRGWGPWDKEEDWEDEKEEEKEKEEETGQENYVDRRKKNLTQVYSSASSLQTVSWTRGLIWILSSYYLTLLLPTLNCMSSL